VEWTCSNVRSRHHMSITFRSLFPMGIKRCRLGSNEAEFYLPISGYEVNGLYVLVFSAVLISVQMWRRRDS
jgi:hypothetical protein